MPFSLKQVFGRLGSSVGGGNAGGDAAMIDGGDDGAGEAL